MEKKNILWFKDISKSDIPAVGGKGANLGEMTSFGIPVPPGFAVTSYAYFNFLTKSSLEEKVKFELKGLNIDNTDKLMQASHRIKTAILRAKMPEELAKDIREAYHRLSGTHDLNVAVRSSATAEDLPDASFAGQQSTFLNVRGVDEVVKKVQECWASLFTPRAIFYRADLGYDHFKVGISAIVQKMIESEVSGIMFTVDPLTNDRSRISIESIFGLGEAIVSGSLTPDQYLVDKESLKIVKKVVVSQDWQLVRKGKVKISQNYRDAQKLKDPEIVKLAQISKNIEAHYDFPQDIEWAYSNGEMYIVQTRPITTLKVKDIVEISDSDVDEKFLLSGIPASPGVAIGKVMIVKTIKDLQKVKEGDILVARMTRPDYVPAMKRAVAVVTDEGGRTSHAAIVSRELGIPCIVGTGSATTMLRNGESITVDGQKGRVYEGKLKTETEHVTVDISEREIKTATKVYVNVADPSEASSVAALNCDGVGLLRAEFILATIGEHPRHFLENGRRGEFVEKLALGIEQVAAAFYPRPVIYRATDFKTNEYRGLKGGQHYEHEEDNPLIGYRGALRYVTDAEVFKMELDSLRYVRNKKEFRNVHLMIPFVRTVEELTEVKKIVSAAGLRRGGNFHLWIMAEIPSNILLLEEFALVGIDGISIGSNDLAMLTLGADRDNSKTSKYTEQDPAVMMLIEQAVKKARKLGITSSICGEAPSSYPHLVRELVKWGITSVSVNPDKVDSVRKLIHECEKDLVISRHEKN